MKNITPKIPIRLPINSTVPPNSTSAGAHKRAINAPTTIIGIPTPMEICFEAMYVAHSENYMKFVSYRKVFSTRLTICSTLSIIFKDLSGESS